MVFPQCLACLTSEQCVSWCIHICFPLPILIHETTQWSLKFQDGVIIEIEKMCIFSYSFLFQLLLQLYVNQFKQLCFQNRVNRNGTVIYGKQHNPIVNWKFNPMITAFFFKPFLLKPQSAHLTGFRPSTSRWRLEQVFRQVNYNLIKRRIFEINTTTKLTLMGDRYVGNHHYPLHWFWQSLIQRQLLYHRLYDHKPENLA